MWRDLLTEAVKNTSRQAVADDLQVSRTTISLVMADKYPAKTDKIEERVLSIYGRVQCPHLDYEITLAECRNFHQSDVPTSSPRVMKHWRACQGCQHNTCKEKS